MFYSIIISFCYHEDICQIQRTMAQYIIALEHSICCEGVEMGELGWVVINVQIYLVVSFQPCWA